MTAEVTTLAAVLVLALNARGQEVTPLVAQPDRPSFTLGIHIVPAGHVQVELGSTVTFVGGEKDFGLGELRVRVPFASWGEVRLGVASYDWHVVDSNGPGGSSARPTQGFAVSQLDFKIRLIDSETTGFGFAAGAKLPGGGGPDREIHAQPLVALSLEQALSKVISLTANIAGNYASTREGEQFALLLAGVSVSVAASDRISVYGEMAAWSRLEPGGSPVEALSAGIQFLLTKKICLDFRVGFGFGQTSPDWLTGIGATFLF